MAKQGKGRTTPGLAGCPSIVQGGCTGAPGWLAPVDALWSWFLRQLRRRGRPATSRESETHTPGLEQSQCEVELMRLSRSFLARTRSRSALLVSFPAIVGTIYGIRQAFHGVDSSGHAASFSGSS